MELCLYFNIHRYSEKRNTTYFFLKKGQKLCSYTACTDYLWQGAPAVAQPGQGKILSGQHKIIMSFTLFFTKPPDIFKFLGNHSLVSFSYDFFCYT